MTITISLSTDNAAFGDGDDEVRYAEVLRILKDWLDDAEVDGTFMRNRLRDANGNIVGSVKVDRR